MRTVLVRQKLLHGNGNRMLRCEILGQNDDGTFRCKCDGDPPLSKPRNVAASEMIPVEKVYGSFRRGDSIVNKSYSQSPWSLGNLLHKNTVR
jgi:hypothetical protein